MQYPSERGVEEYGQFVIVSLVELQVMKSMFKYVYQSLTANDDSYRNGLINHDRST